MRNPIVSSLSKNLRFAFARLFAASRISDANLTIRSHRSWGSKNVDFCALARGQGVEATAVDSCETLDEAFANVTEPNLVEVAVD